MAKAFKRKGDRIVAQLGEAEREVVVGLLRQTHEFLAPEPREPTGDPFDDLVARLEGKSSLGRLGLLIHSTAGYVDPGWKGNLTLELSNVANLPIALYYGMKIGQISFFQLTTAAETPYGSAGNKYQNQQGPTASRFHEEFTKEP